MEGPVDLGTHLESYVEGLVQDGRYASRDEVLRESVKALRERERLAALAELEASLVRGMEDIAAGRFTPLEEVTARLTAKCTAMAEARSKA